MAIIAQSLFRWEEIEDLGDLERLRLVLDAEYELPVAFEITKASAAKQPEARELFKQLKKRHSKLIEGCQYALGDKGYDDGKLLKELWDEDGIKPVIDVRRCITGRIAKGEGAVRWRVRFGFH